MNPSEFETACYQFVTIPPPRRKPSMKFISPLESYRWIKALWDQRCNARMSREQLEASQLRKFRRLVAYAQRHSPYYRALIEQRKIDPARCVPTDFPVHTKMEVIRHFDDLVTDRRITRERIAEFLGTHPAVSAVAEGAGPVLTLKVSVASSAGPIGEATVRVKLSDPPGRELSVPVTWGPP